MKSDRRSKNVEDRRGAKDRGDFPTKEYLARQFDPGSVTSKMKDTAKALSLEPALSRAERDTQKARQKAWMKSRTRF